MPFQNKILNGQRILSLPPSSTKKQTSLCLHVTLCSHSFWDIKVPPTKRAASPSSSGPSETWILPGPCYCALSYLIQPHTHKRQHLSNNLNPASTGPEGKLKVPIVPTSVQSSPSSFLTAWLVTPSSMARAKLQCSRIFRNPGAQNQWVLGWEAPLIPVVAGREHPGECLFEKA